MKYLYSILLAVALALPGTAQAIVFFDTDFETCAVGTHNDFPCDGWTDEGSPGGPEWVAAGGNVLEITNALAFSGSKSVKGTWTNINGSTINQPSIYATFTSSDHVFVRFATRQSVGFQIGSNNLTKMVRFRTSGGYPVFFAMLGANKFITALERSYSGGTYTLTSGVTPSQTSWDQVEVEWKLNTPGKSDGLLRMWVNDVLRTEQLNQQFRGPLETSVDAQGVPVPSTTKFNGAQIYVQSGLGSIYYDRFAVAPASHGRIGTTGTTPPPVDTIPPTPPTSPAANTATSTISWINGSDTGGSGLATTQVQRCTGGGCTAFATVGTVQSTVTQFVDASAQAGIVYLYRMRHFDGAGNPSIFTSTVSLTIPTTNRRVLYTFPFGADAADIGSTMDAGYTTGNSFKLASGKIAPTVGFARNFETYNVAVPNDQFVSIQASDGVSATDNIYVLMRTPAPPTWNGYECGVLDTTSGRLQRIDAGTGTLLAPLATLSPALAIGDRIRGESQGSTHRCYIVRTNAQGVQSEELFASGADATYASGRVGARVAAEALPSIRISEFLAGDFTAAVDSTITHDNTVVTALTNVANPLTWTHTVGTADNRILNVCLQSRNSTAPLTVTRATANGVSLTSVRNDSFTGANSLNTSVWQQIAPSPGVNTITATFSAAPSNWAVGSSSSFSGVEQVTPTNAVGGANGTGTAVSLPITTTVTGTLAFDCVAGLDSFTAAGGSQTIRTNGLANPGIDGVASSTKSLSAAGAATTAWTQAVSTIWAGSVTAMTPAQVNNLQRPKVLTATLTPTGASGITYDTTTPTSLLVQHGQNSGANVQEVVVPIADVVGGVLTRTWNIGDEFARILARDKFGAVNSANLEYFADSLVGIAPAANVNAVVMSSLQPANGTELPAGTTSANITMTIDQPQLSRECRASTSDVDYATMAATYQMTINATVASVAYPVSNGNGYTIYRTCVTLDSGGAVTSESAARSVSTFTVANTTVDVTPPGTVTNLVCQANGTQGDCTHSAAADAVSYEAYLSTNAGVSYVLAKEYTGTSFSLINLPANQSYSVKVLARDVVGNPSSSGLPTPQYSNIATIGVAQIASVLPPANVPFMTVVPFASSVLVFFQVGGRATNTTVEYCASAACTPGTFSKTAASSPMFIEGLTSGVLYRFTSFHTDADGRTSVSKYPIIDTTTITTSLSLRAPRSSTQFGVSRPSSVIRTGRDLCGE